jgi:hypothetical protein
MKGRLMPFPNIPFNAIYAREDGKYQVGKKLTVIKKIDTGFRVRLENGLEDEICTDSVVPCKITITKETLETQIANYAEEIKKLEDKLMYIQQTGESTYLTNKNTSFTQQ